MDKNLNTTLDKYYEFWFAISNLYEKWAKKYGLNANSLYLLQTVKENPDKCTQSMIAKKLLLPKQTINSILMVFEKKGYIEKIADTNDKRSKIIVLTQAGHSFADEILSNIHVLEIKALANMTAKQRIALIDSTHTFLREMRKVFD